MLYRNGKRVSGVSCPYNSGIQVNQVPGYATWEGERCSRPGAMAALTGLLAGARVHLLDGACGSFELTGPRRTCGRQSDVPLPAR